MTDNLFKYFDEHPFEDPFIESDFEEDAEKDLITAIQVFLTVGSKDELLAIVMQQVGE